MTNKVYFNGRSAVHALSEGILNTISINYTGRRHKPIAYKNVTKSQDAKNTATTVFANQQPLCHEGSVFSKSCGDEPGEYGGIHSGTVNGKAEFLMASPNIFIEGKAVVRQFDLMVSNCRNSNAAKLQQSGQCPHVAKQREIKDKKRNNKDDVYHIYSDILIDKAMTLATKLQVIQNKEQSVSIPFAQKSDKNNNITRIVLRGLTSVVADLNMLINNRYGDVIKVPLTTNSKPNNSKHDKPKVGAAENTFIPVKLRWLCKGLYPEKTTGEDWCDLARLAYHLRDKVYKSLLKNNANADNWLQAIKPKLREQVKEALQVKNNSELRSGGWIYIFLNNCLWRELQVKEMNYLAEVDLSTFAGKDERLATGVWQSSLVLPYKLQNKIQKLSMTYSEIQWSWARINFFGGMAVNDRRIQYKTEEAGLLASAKQLQHAHQAQQQRLQDIDLQPCLHRRGESKYYIPKKHMVSLYYNKTCQFNTLLLADPLGLLVRLNQDLSNAWQQFICLLQLIKNTKHNPYFHSALLSYQIFYNPALVKKNSQGKHNILFKNRQYIDKHGIEKVLQVTRRQNMRHLIRRLQKAVICLLQDIHIPALQKEHIPALRHEGVDINIAFQDLFAANNQRFSCGYTALAGLLTLTCNDPSELDADLNVEHGISADNLSPGIRYMQTVFDPQHILHNIILPNQEQILHFRQQQRNTKITKVYQQQEYQYQQEHNDGSSKFRPISYANNFHGLTVDTWHQNHHDSFQSIAKILKYFIKIFMKAWRHGVQSQLIDIEQMAINLVHMTEDKQLQTLGLKQIIEMDESEDVIGLYGKTFNNNLQTIKSQEIKYKGHPLKPSSSQGIPVRTIYLNSKIKQEYKFDHERVIPEYAFKDFQAEYPLSGDNDLLLQQLKASSNNFSTFFTISNDNIKKPWHLHSLKPISKIISGIVGVFGLWNIIKSIMAFGDLNDPHGNVRKVTDLIQAFCIEGYAIESAFVNFTSKETLENLYANISKSLTGFMDISAKQYFCFTPLSFLGLLGCLIGDALSVCDFRTALLSHDRGQEWGDGFNIIGSSFNTLGIISTSAKIARQRISSLTKSLDESNIDKILEDTVAEDIITTMNEVNIFLASFEALAGILALPFTEILFVFAIFSLIGTIIDMLFKDGPLEHWTKTCPFNIWHTTSMTDYDACETLMNILMAPRLKLLMATSMQQSKHEKIIMLDVILPYFPAHTATLDTRFAIHMLQRQYSSDNETGIGQHYHTQILQRQSIRPFLIEQVINQDMRIARVHYYYRISLSDKLLSYQENIWDRAYGPISFQCVAKGRLYLDNKQYVLPAVEQVDHELPANDHAYDENDQITNIDDDPTWLYAEPYEFTF